MRRSPALALTLALFASTVAVANPTAAVLQPAGIAYTGTDTGNLSTAPFEYLDGQTIELYANFDANIGINDVTFYEETSPDDFSAIGTDEANTYGNAYKRDYVVHGEQRIFAQVVEGPHAGEVTEIDTITPSAAVPIDPNNYPDTGNLTTDPTTFTTNQQVKVSANFPDGIFNVTLYKETSPGVWTDVGHDESNSSGNAYFLNYQVSGTQKLFALASHRQAHRGRHPRSGPARRR